MIWEQFKTVAVKEYGYLLCYDDHKEMCEVVDKNGLEFYENGKIKTYMGDVVAENKTIDQMFAIIEILEMKSNNSVIEGLVKKLDIATKALECYDNPNTWCCCAKNHCTYVDGSIAHIALKEIKENN